jgi:hypothetical protein
MFLAGLVLVLSTALFFFYFQATCQKFLRRQFEQEYFRSIVSANRLEFLSVQNALQQYGAPIDYSRLRMMLKCDFLALTYLLKNAANVSQSYSREERLLMAYFRLVFFSLVTRHVLRMKEKPAVLKLTAILQYFANVVGQRVTAVRTGNLSASDYLLSL